MSHDQLSIPSYRHHKARGLAVVTLNGKDVYLGKYNSPESRAEYERAVGEWLARGRVLDRPARSADITVDQLMLAYLDYAQGHYRDRDGQTTREIATMVLAFRPLRQLYGHTSAAEFSPLCLKTVRQKMITDRLCRRVINQRSGYIKRMFAWGASEELIPPVVHYGLLSIKGLQPYRDGVRETEPVKPVPDEYVDVIVPFLPPTLQCMLILQRLTGMRSGELVQMRTCDIDTTGTVWLYRPARHKNSWRRKDRVIPLGPRCIEAIRPYLKIDISAPLFSPAQAEAERRDAKRAKRKTRVQPSQISRARRNPRRKAGRSYDTRSYHKALRYAMLRAERAGVLAREHFWHPHQLRHTTALRIQRAQGIDVARAYLGHAKPDITAMYSGIDTATAISVAAQWG